MRAASGPVRTTSMRDSGSTSNSSGRGAAVRGASRSLIAKSQTNDIISQIDLLASSVYWQEVRFECFLFSHCLIYFALQYYNVYRNNYRTYNYRLAVLVLLIIARRLLTRYVKTFRVKSQFLSDSRHTWMAVIIKIFVAINTVLIVVLLLADHGYKTMWLFVPLLVWTALFSGDPPFEKLTNYADRFRWQMKMILCDTLEIAWAVGFLPLIFLKLEYIFYDSFQVGTLILFLTMNTALLLFHKLLSEHFVELYVQATKSGGKAGSSSADGGASANPTSDDQHWASFLLHLLFSDPYRMHSWILYVQRAVVIILALLFIVSRFWVLYAVLCFLNFVILYQCLRIRRDNLEFIGIASGDF